MSTRDDILRQASEARAVAAKAQRLALSLGISGTDVAARLIAYAQEMDAKASSLEAQVRASDLSLPPLVDTRSQHQVHEQSGAPSRCTHAGPERQSE